MTPPRPADVWLVRYDTPTLQVAIRAGENDGLTVPHKNIVRELVLLGGGGARSYRIPRSSTAGLKTAIILQNPDGGPIIAAVKD